MSLLINGALICLITFSLFVLAELSVRFFAPQFEERFAWNGVSATTPDKELQYVLTPNYHAIMNNPEFNPQRVEYKTNSQGFRDHRTYEQTKSPETTRFLILGDSFAYGAAADYSDIWPVVFEKELTSLGYKVEVIKAGVFGYDTRQEVLYLKRLLPKYKPDIVIVAFLLNDLFTNTPVSLNASDSRSGVDETNARREALIGQKFAHLHLLALTKKLLLKNDSVYSSIYLRTQRSAFFDPNSALLQRQLAITKRLLLEGRTDATKNSAAFVVLSIPQAFQVINTDKHIDVSFVDTELGKFASKSNFLWISGLPIFREAYARKKEDLHYRVDGHLTSKGNLLVGKLLAARFAEILRRKEGTPGQPGSEFLVQVNPPAFSRTPH